MPHRKAQGSPDAEVRPANKAITRTAERITAEVRQLFARPFGEHVARDYVVERFMSEIIKRNPEVLDWLNGIDGGSGGGKGSMRLAEALADWRDQWVSR